MRDDRLLTGRTLMNGDITKLLGAVKSGDRAAEADLMRLIYPELRKLAAARLRNERPGFTLQATELVNEIYLRFAGQLAGFENGLRLKAAAAHILHHILVDHARTRNAVKRGHGDYKLDLEGLGLA